LLPVLNEAQRRWYIAQKALELGRGGIERVHAWTGISRATIRKGLRELCGDTPLDLVHGVRHTGGGRKRHEISDPLLVHALECLLEETTAGDPMSALKWTAKSTRMLARELTHAGHVISADTVDRLLHDLDYSLQGNRKTREGPGHPDRDAQFRYVNEQVKAFIATLDPVISVDCKKKERVGQFKNAGETWRKQGHPREVNVYDFPRLAVGTAIPYGTYDVRRNEGLVNVGITHETAEFAIESIRQWWQRVGRQHYQTARRLLICADGGGSNGSRNRAWKLHLQTLANEMRLAITVCHYPPGASKWNKIEHRMFSFISLNWKGQPLVSYETIIHLIGATTTRGGLHIKARIDRRAYRTGIKLPPDALNDVRITRHETFPRWNYTISPQ
jgi:hypothetical protein